MLADCQWGHERVRMEPVHVRKAFRCPECGAEFGFERIMQAVPREYAPAFDPIVRTLQLLADYEILGVLSEDGSIFIEYPKRGQA